MFLSFLCSVEYNFCKNKIGTVKGKWKALLKESQNVTNQFRDMAITQLPKINFFIHFFLDILQFKESWSLIGWEHFGP